MKVVNRIKKNEEFATVVKKGHTLKTSSYIIHYLDSEKEICRIGISVSKKVGNAVTRNRIKRQIRAMCDSLVSYSFHTFDIVIVVRKDFLNNDFHNNLEILKQKFKEIGILK